MILLLFDVDLTLINTGGAGRRSMTLAFESLFGFPNGFKEVDFAGRTDVLIFKDALANNGLVWRPEVEDRFKKTYLRNLKAVIKKDNPDQHVEPGVPKLLDVLSKREDVVLGLLTGNWRDGARVKLEHFNLFDRFSLGAFADDSELRKELPGIAAQRFERQFGTKASPSDVFVIGDTPLDVACARPFGATSIAVATGFFSIDELKAERPDYAFEDLSDLGAFLSILDERT